MNFDVLNLIIALCVGAADTQVCHKKFQTCIEAQKTSIAAEVVQCGSFVDEVLMIKCKDTAFRKEKPVAIVLQECL